mmetsp:Transcript_70882/g.188620  ORF Transcript_70882/g.188620 Transcript_70882/m.188620 type:complete len:258 (-) Transcript_70882:138-911(-)
MQNLLAILVTLLVLVRVRGQVAGDEDDGGVAQVELDDEPALVAQHPRDPRRRRARLDAKDGRVAALPERLARVDRQPHLPQHDVVHHHVLGAQPLLHHRIPHGALLVAARALRGRGGLALGAAVGEGDLRHLDAPALRHLVVVVHVELLGVVHLHRRGVAALGRVLLERILLRPDGDDIVVAATRWTPMRELLRVWHRVADVPCEREDLDELSLRRAKLGLVASLAPEGHRSREEGGGPACCRRARQLMRGCDVLSR